MEASRHSETFVGSTDTADRVAVTREYLPQATVIGKEAGSPIPDELHVPGYELIDELGRGGMGVVYRARQLKLNRTVALKMIRAGLTAGEDERRRFQREAESVAQLQHPGIVQIFEVGEANGQPFLALEFIDGKSLDAILDDGPMPPRDAAQLVEQLADAVDAAHRSGIVHRDLKPGNVLMADRTTPKITDFGLAKRTEEQGQTQTGLVVGTPSYMAPEQAIGDSRQIGPPADVYALGAILYETLSGRPPFTAASMLATIELVRKHDPVPLRQLQPGIPRDLETICLKCLQKEPAKRYVSAAALAADLQRFLNGEPIQARPVGTVERLAKWMRRRPALASMIGVVATAIVVVLGVSFSYQSELRNANDDLARALTDAEKKRHEADTQKGIATEQAKLAEDRLRAERKQNYALIIQQIDRYWRQPTPAMPRSRELLESAKPKAGDPDLRGFEWHYLKRALYPELQSRAADGGAFVKDGRLILLFGEYIEVQTNGKTSLRLSRGNLPRFGVVSPDGRRMAASQFGVGLYWIDVDRPRNAHEIPFKEAIDRTNPSLHSLAWSPDSRYIAAIAQNWARAKTQTPRILVWDVQTGQRVAEYKPHSDAILKIAFSPDGKWIGSGSADKTAVIYDFAQRKIAGKVSLKDGVRGIAFSPDSTRFLTADYSGEVTEWKTDNRQRLRGWNFRNASPLCVIYAPDGHTFALGTARKTVVVFDPQRRKLSVFKGHDEPVESVQFSPDGSRLLSLDGNSLKVWDPRKDHRFDEVDAVADLYQSVCYSPDGRLFAYGGLDAFGKGDNEIIIRNAKTLAVLHRIKNIPVRHLAFSPNGKLLAVTSADINDNDQEKKSRRETVLIDVKTGKVQRRLSAKGTRILYARFENDDRVWLGGEDGSVRIVDVHTRKEIRSITIGDAQVVSLAISSENQRVYVRTLDMRVNVYDLKSLQPVGHFEGNLSTFEIAASPNGKRVALPTPNPVLGRDPKPAAMRRSLLGIDIEEFRNHVDIVDAKTRKVVHRLAGHTKRINAVAFSPDSRRLATGASDGLIKIWDLDTGHELLTINPSAGVLALAFSPDARELLCSVVVQGGAKLLRFGGDSKLDNLAQLPKARGPRPAGRVLIAQSSTRRIPLPVPHASPAGPDRRRSTAGSR